MKKLVVWTAVAGICAGAAIAGGMAEPVVEPEVIVEDTAGTAGGFLVPLLALLLIAVALSGGGSSSEGT